MPPATIPAFDNLISPSDVHVWQWQAKDKDGKLVDFSPGNTWCFMKVEGKYERALAHANIYLRNARVEVCTNGQTDPEYQVIEETLVPIQKDNSALGEFRMPGAVPLTLGVGKSYPEAPVDFEF